MKRARRSTHSIHSGIPNVWRVRPSWSSTTHHLPYFQTTYGWVTTRVPRACLLERLKSGDGRAWEISLVVLTLVSGTFRTAFSDIPFAHSSSSFAVISSGLTVGILVYECVVRTKEVNGHSCSVPVHHTLVSVQACHGAGRREV